MVKKGRISTEVISEGNTDLVNEATKDMYACSMIDLELRHL